MTETRLFIALGTIFFISLLPGARAHAEAIVDSRWVQTWGASPQPRNAGEGHGPTITSRTLLQRFHISAGGHAMRLKLSNAWGNRSLQIEAASVFVVKGAAPEPRRVTFGGSPSVTIPPGAPALSDAVSLETPALSEVEVRLFVSEATPIDTIHAFYPDNVETRVSEPGDHTQQQAVPFTETLDTYAFLSGLDVYTQKPVNTVVAFGDSITNGIGPNRSWPARLANLLSRPNGSPESVSVVNAGIGGNMLLNDNGSANALARFDRDVLATTGITHVIVLLGLNDIGWRNHFLRTDSNATIATAANMISSFRQLIRRAHAHGVKIYGGTLTPFAGAEKKFPEYYTPEGEKIRLAVNHWIRTSGEFDAVIDFDQALRNPNAPSTLLPEYDSGDHLHPNEAGHLAMIKAIDLSFFATQENPQISAVSPGGHLRSADKHAPPLTKPTQDIPP